MKALVLFSGGQDSTTILAWSINRYEEVECISFKYNQKHEAEIEQARIICNLKNIKHKVVDISFYASLVDSELTNNGDVSKMHDRIKELPSNFVPNRNALFLTLAHSYAQKKGYSHIVTGVCETDYNGYPDCRDVFIKSIETTLNLASLQTISIVTPLMFLSKAQIFKLAEEEGILDIVLEHSLTCYNGADKVNEYGKGCGGCEACRLRESGYLQYLNNKL